MTSDVFQPFLTPTYHVRRFLPYNIRDYGAFLDLPSYLKIGRHLWTFPYQFILTFYTIWTVYKPDNCFKFVKENTQMYELSYFKKKIRLKFDQIKLEVSYRISKVRNRSKYVSMQIHPNKTFLLHPVFTIISKIFPNSNYFSILERKILRSLK